jgi:DNA (cytosine-5)-methyltransferase 1
MVGSVNKRKLRVVSLFAGCGGLDLGFVGGFKSRNLDLPANKFELVFANDFDRNAEEVYNKNSKKFFKGHEMQFGDIRQIDEKLIPEFDVLLAGFPCQPFSNAGNRGSTEDSKGRGTLFYECERILKYAKKVQEVQPLAFVFENVRGILSSKMPDGKPVVDEISERMKKLGYQISVELVNASDYGVPQNRYRVLIIGVRKDIAPFEFSELTNVCKTFGLPGVHASKYDLTLGRVLSDIPKTSPQFNQYWPYSESDQRMIELIGPCEAGSEYLSKFKRGTSISRMPEYVSVGRSWKNIPVRLLTPRFRRIHDDPAKYHAPNFYRRFALGEICGTITASAQPANCGITHPFENRRMTVREIARVQSFPDDFDFSTRAIQGAYKVIGNAVPPVLGWVVARSLQNHLSKFC